MHNSWIPAAVLAVSLGVSGAGIAAGPTTAPTAGPPVKPAVAANPKGPSDRAQILALETGYSAGFNAKDIKKLMSYYARDGLFVFDVTPPRQHVGWEDYRKDWEDLFAAYPGPVTFKMSDVSVTVVGPVAYGHNIQDASFTDKDGTKAEVVVRVTDVYRKLAGKWVIVQEHVSVPVDLATMKPDILSRP